MNQLKLVVQLENTAFYTENAVIPQTTAKIYVQWYSSTSRKRKKPFKSYGKSNKELNAIIEKKDQKCVKNKKRMKTEKEIQHFQEIQISDDESKKSLSIFAESVESGEISASSSEWKIGSDELFVTCINDNSDKIAKPNKITWIFLFILI